jgi:membrane-associated phospholipid phosphatase
MLAFLAVNSAVVLFRAGAVGAWPLLLLGNVLTVLLVGLLVAAPRSRFVTFIGGAYPILLSLAFYTQLGVMHLDVAHLYDRLVQGWEQALFGSQVSVTWHERMPSLVLSWVLHFCYGSYYWIVAVGVLALYLRAPAAAFERGVFLVALGFYTCYVIFAVFPVAGPRYFFGNATGPIAEVLPARLVRGVLEGGSAVGTAFPSSHVVAAWCATAALWRPLRRWFWFLAPVALGLAPGTVYGQFHYGVDAVAGVVLAVALIAAAPALWRACARGTAAALEGG